MSSRVFKSMWNCQENGSINDFISLSKSIYNSLKVIDEEYADFFNSNSSQSIKKIIMAFDKSFEKFLDICYKKDVLNYDRTDPSWLTHTRFNLKEKDLKDDVITVEALIHKNLNEKYLFQIKPEIDKIFDIEDSCAPIIRELWKKKITPISEYDPDGEFQLLIRVLSDWRKYENLPDKEKYMESRIGASCSLITNNRVEKFELGKSDFGYIVDIKKGFLGATNQDAYLEERILGYYPEIGSYLVKFNDMFRIYNNKENELFTAVPTSKISIPSEIVEKSSQVRHNEVIVDRRKSKPCAVFYLSYGQKMICKDYEKAYAFAEKTGLPLIEIKYLNLNYKHTYIDNLDLTDIEKKEMFDSMKPSEQLQAVLKFKSANEFVVSNYEHNMAKFIVESRYEVEYRKLFYNEIDDIAEKIIIKNPQTPQELNNVIVDYFTGKEVDEKIKHFYKPEIQKVLVSKQNSDSETINIDSHENI